MAKRDKTDRLLGSMKEKRTPIGTNIYIPNNSGDHVRSIKRDTPIDNADLSNKKYVDDQITSSSTNDRARANHTGTQTAATISDFDTEVSNNTDVTTNSAKISYTDAAAVALNTTHRSSVGTDHSNVGLNNTHRTGSGADHEDVATNSTHSAGNGMDHSQVATNAEDIGANTAHRTSNGSDHSFIDQDVTGTASPEFTSVICNYFRYGIVTPAPLEANVNNWAPGAYSFIRLAAVGNYNITGIAAQSAGFRIILVNTTNNTQTLKDQDANSDAANRFLNNTGADITLAQHEMATLIYDNIDSRWRVAKL